MRSTTGGSAHRLALALAAAALALSCARDPSDFRDGNNSGDSGSPQPARVALELPLVSVSASGGHTCVVSASGRAYCWGQNQYGELGDGSTRWSRVPTALAGDVAFASVSLDGFVVWPEYPIPGAFAAFTCGLDRGGIAYCWGDDTYTQMGNGHPLCVECTWPVYHKPVRVPGGPFRELSAGNRTVCAIANDARTYCWGEFSGSIDGRPHAAVGPRPVLSPVAFTELAVGQLHACGLTDDGLVYCWGKENLTGRTTAPFHTPSLIESGLCFSHIAAGARHTCGITVEGRVYCWGEGSLGQLGTGTLDAALHPVAVLGQS